MPGLRLVVTTGMRNRVLDLDACDAGGIAVCGTPSLASPTVELTWGLILSLARGIPQQEQRLRQGAWQQGTGLGLEGATLSIAGLGRIGAGVAAIGRAFGMRLLAWSPNMTAATAEAAGAELVDKETLFRQADILTLHLGLGPTTRGIAGAAELALMRRGALLVNTARGPLVDQPALIAALRSGQLGAPPSTRTGPSP
ncbi:NAD(P)-dependent oxidoreductase [Pseudoroseomonas wenyumeiae]